MFYTYVLQNENKRWYIGYTNDLQNRYRRHQKGEVYSTKRIGGNWKLIYYEACVEKTDAMQREKFLKSGLGRNYLKRRLKFHIKN
ncbi:GIY-YIG nuclease family protein [Patescibacteria group bacterium]